MALQYCTKCGHLVSTTAPKCPSCGLPPYGSRVASISGSTNAPTAQRTVFSTNSENVASASRLPQRLVLTLRIPNVRMVIVATLALIAALFHLPTTPSWALYSMYRDVEAHDGAAASQFVDFESVTKSFINMAMAEPEKAEAESGDDEGDRGFAEVFGRGIANLMVGPVSEAFKSRFEEWVDSRDDRKDPISAAPVLEAILRIRSQGSSAFTHVTNDNGDTIDITLTRQRDGDWFVTTVDGNALRESMRDSANSADNGSSGDSDSAKRIRAQADISALKTGLDRYTSDQGLPALVSEPSSGKVPSDYPPGEYIERIPNEPWGNPYFYKSDGNSYVLKSFGADGVEGGTGENADIDESSNPIAS